MSFEYWLMWNYGWRVDDLSDDEYVELFSRYEFENVE